MNCAPPSNMPMNEAASILSEPRGSDWLRAPVYYRPPTRASPLNGRPFDRRRGLRMSLGLLLIAVPTLLATAAPDQARDVSSAKETNAKTHEPAIRHRLPSDGPQPTPQGRSKSCPEGMIPAQKWKPADLVGFTLSLVDAKRRTSFRFGEEGWVAATFGQVDGPVTAPLLKWRIDKGGLLHIEEVGGGRPRIRLRKQCASDGAFIVDLDGVREDFRREKQ